MTSNQHGPYVRGYTRVTTVSYTHLDVYKRQALQRVNPGDTVFLREGSYGEFVVPTRSGKPGKMITLKSYPGEIAKIDGSDLYIKGWGNALVPVSYTHLQQLCE